MEDLGGKVGMRGLAAWEDQVHQMNMLSTTAIRR